MKIQNLAIIFIVIILPLLMILGYYLNLQKETLVMQADYNSKLSSSVKEGIRAYEINTVNWRETKGEERRNVTASINTFLTSLANNLGISGTAKEYMSNYIPAVAMTMYDGYYIYSPAYVPKTIENEKGIQLYYDGTSITTADTTDGKLNDVVYEPASNATHTAWYYYTDDEDREQKKSISFVTDATKAAKEYKHTLSNKIAYSGTYTADEGRIDVTINYTLDNRIYIYGRDKFANKDINEQGCLVYFKEDVCKLPRIRIEKSPQTERDITVINPVNSTVYFGSNINSEVLTEQILYKEDVKSPEKLGIFKYVYDVQGDKLYYDENQGSFFTLSDTKIKQMLPESRAIRAGTEECRYKSVSVLTSDKTYKKLYQVLNGKDKGKWYISLKEDANKITEVGPGVEVIDTEIKAKRPAFQFTAIYRDYSAVSYYVEAYAFTNWMRDRLGGTVKQSKITFDEKTKQYKMEEVTINGLFDIKEDNDLEKAGSLISDHRRQIMIDSINSNLNLSISNYAQNSAGEYRLPALRDADWDQMFTNLSMVAFFQGIPIGLKTYNNYAIATSALNRDYVDPDEIYFISGSTSYHRPYCTKLNLPEIDQSYRGYRSVEYTLKTYKASDVEKYYYQHTNQPSTSANSDLACYYCVVNKANYQKTIDVEAVTTEAKKIKDIQTKAYKEALARERYYQYVEIEGELGIVIKYNENIENFKGLVTAVTNMPYSENENSQEASPGNVRIAVTLPKATTNDPKVKLTCIGWSDNPTAEVPNYVSGRTYNIQDTTYLYAVWKLERL